MVLCDLYVDCRVLHSDGFGFLRLDDRLDDYEVFVGTEVMLVLDVLHLESASETVNIAAVIVASGLEVDEKKQPCAYQSDGDDECQGVLLTALVTVAAVVFVDTAVGTVSAVKGAV